MKNKAVVYSLFVLTFFLALSPLAAMSQLPYDENREAPDLPCGDSSEVTVATIDEPLPTDDDALRDYLWNNYINGPESTKFECRVRDCDQLKKEFTASLIAKVQAKSRALPRGRRLGQRR